MCSQLVIHMFVRFSMSLPNQTYADTRCKDITEIVGWKAIWKNLVNMDEQELYEETGCMAKCQRKEWEIRRIFDDKTEVNGSKIAMWMFYANGRYRVGSQLLTYDFNTYVADFGGYLGLLLGYSIVSFFDKAQEIFNHIMKKAENK